MGREYLTVKILNDNKKFYRIEEKIGLKEITPPSIERNFEKNFLKFFGLILGVSLVHLPFLGGLIGIMDISFFNINGFYLG